MRTNGVSTLKEKDFPLSCLFSCDWGRILWKIRFFLIQCYWVVLHVRLWLMIIRHKRHELWSPSNQLNRKIIHANSRLNVECACMSKKLNRTSNIDGIRYCDSGFCLRWMQIKYFGKISIHFWDLPVTWSLKCITGINRNEIFQREQFYRRPKNCWFSQSTSFLYLNQYLPSES